jgi:hypothetical protein
MAEDAKEPPQKRCPAAARQDRLAAALRANLARRKTQARRRSTDKPTEKPDKTD